MKKREGGDLIVITLVVAVGLSLYVEAAVTLPPEAKMLKRHFYKHNTCNNVEAYVTHQVKYYWDKDKSLTPKLLKLLYADCMVNGCDASILLDGPHTEKKSPKNSGLEWSPKDSGTLDVFVVIDKIKQVLEQRCPRAVSCSDILNLAARDAVNFAGAPSYPVLLGRRDGLESRAEWVDLPSPSISVDQGLAYFQSKGLDSWDYATLLGAHTLGKTHCAYIHDRLYNFNNTRKPDPSMSRSRLDKLRKQCPETLKKGQDDPTVFLTDNRGDEYKFTNAYYTNVLSHGAVLRADQELLYNYNTTQLTLEYAGKFEQFRRQFAFSITRMGTLKVLTLKGNNQSEIRVNCRYTNKNNPYLK